MKRYATIIASVIVLLIAGGMTYCYWPERVELEISARDVVVTEGESVRLEYTANVKEAGITFVNKDKSIAEVKLANGEAYVTGNNAGSTTIGIVARYKDAMYEKEVKIEVEKKVEEKPLDEDKPQEAVDEGGQDEENKPKEETVYVAICEECLVNCSFEEGEIKLQKGKKGIIQFEFKEEYTNISIQTNGLVVKKATGLGNNTYTITASEEGEYELVFVIDNTKYEKFKVRVI